MQDIKKRWKPYYDEKKHFLRLEQFVLFEMALMIVNRWKQDADANKGYIVFTKYQNIGKKQYVPEDYIIQNASVCLRKFRSEKMWKDTLKEYKKDEYAGIRLYDITEDRIVEKKTGNLVYAARKKDYLCYILSYSRSRDKRYATHGAYRYFNKNNEDKQIYITLNEELDEMICDVKRGGEPRKKIVITMEELLNAAEEIQEKRPGDPCARILKTNVIKAVKNGSVSMAEQLELERVVNIVGMVGAGKTTLLKVLAYILDQRKKRTVIVTDTVAEVFQLYRYFRSLGASAAADRQGGTGKIY